MGGEEELHLLERSSLPQLSAGPVGQQVSSIYKERLRQFTGRGQYESQNLQACVLETSQNPFYGEKFSPRRITN